MGSQLLATRISAGVPGGTTEGNSNPGRWATCWTIRKTSGTNSGFNGRFDHLPLAGNAASNSFPSPGHISINAGLPSLKLARGQ
jgi:hypothetical protein